MTIDTPRPRVLICDPIDPAGRQLLEQFVEVDESPNLSPAELLLKIAEYDGLIVRSATQVTADVIERGIRLKIIGRAGAGLDNIDVTAAQAKEIQVVNAPDANTIAVTEHTFALMLALARHLPLADASLKSGKWAKSKLMGSSLAGKTLGIVGFGRIGRQLAIRAQAFGMKVLVNQRRQTPELDLENKVHNVDLTELLQEADFVTLHVPFKPETKKLIGREQLALMKPTAIIVNTARGGVIDEEALLEALNSGRLAGAGLDVFENEPAPNPALVQHERVLATPHIAASTADAQRQAAVAVAEQFIEALRDVEGEMVLPLRVVPMDKIFPHESIDQKRVDKLAGRIEEEGALINPPVVMPVGDSYMVLDGATRTAAFKQLGYPHTVVQISSPEVGLGLHTWYHIIQKIEMGKLLNLLQNLPGLSLVEGDPGRADDDLFTYGHLCYLKLTDGRVFFVQAEAGTNRLDALNLFTETYIEASLVDRTLNKNMVTLQLEYPHMTALVVFPEYTVSQVMQVTLSGRYFPAGITRFLIPGRILRIRVALSLLKSKELSLREKNQWLQNYLKEKLSQNAIRYYGEPVYLLDE